MGGIWCVDRVNLSQTLQWNSPRGVGLLDYWLDKVSWKSNFLLSLLPHPTFLFFSLSLLRREESYDWYYEKKGKTHSFNDSFIKHSLCMWSVLSLVAQLHLTLQIHGLYSLPGSFVHGTLQTGILEWIAIPYPTRRFRMQNLLHCRRIFYCQSCQGYVVCTDHLSTVGNIIITGYSWDIYKSQNWITI